MKWYLKVLRNYFVFGGRARRKEYWMFALVSFIIALAIAIIESTFMMPGVFSTLYSLFVFFPGLAVAIRRLHDTGKSGLWILISLIPLIGFIVLLIFFCQDSETGSNKYGSNPKIGYY